jgi:hypothetical protein
LAQGRNFFNIQKKFSAEEKLNKGNCFYAGLRIRITLMQIRIPSFYLNADPDTTFHFTADPEPASHQSDANLQPLVYRPFKAPF